jgi:hypothetical protein
MSAWRERKAIMTAEAEELRTAAIRPALKALESFVPYSLAAENLVLGTAAHESGGFKWRRQQGAHGIPTGPALGLWQIEPATLTDIYDNFLKFRPRLERAVESCLPHGEAQIDRLAQLETNDRYGAALCRLKYVRSPVKLPADPNDVFEMGRQWAAVYNTRFPAQRFIDDYRRYVEDMTDAQIVALGTAASTP